MYNKDKITLLRRLRIAYLFIRGKFMKNVSIITCYCGSCELTPISEPIESNINNIRTWSIIYKCDKCGAICNEVQTWNNLKL